MKKLFIGIDESGSSVYKNKMNIFVLCAVVFDYDEYSLVANKIAKFLKTENIKELKFSKISSIRTKKLIKILSKHSHFVISRTEELNVGFSIEDIYNKCLMSIILEISSLSCDTVSIQIDQMQGERKQQKIKKKINQKLKSIKTCKVDFIDSHKSIAVQIADIYAGRIRHEALKTNFKI